MIQLASTDSAARSRDKLSEQVYHRLKADLHEFLFAPVSACPRRHWPNRWE